MLGRPLLFTSEKGLLKSGTDKGVTTKKVLSLQESLESLNSPGNGQILLSYPVWGISKISRISTFLKRPLLPKDPFSHPEKRVSAINVRIDDVWLILNKS